MMTNTEATPKVEPKVYKVPAANLETLQDRIGKLNKRAVKLGCQPIALQVSEPKKEEVPVRDPLDPDGATFLRDHNNKVITKTRVYYEIQLQGEAPKYAGWTFVAAMEFLAANGENEAAMFLRVAPGQAIPDSYRHANQKCDHCGTVRRRNETFVVRHEDGTHKQVGRQCIADFLGHTDPERYCQIAEWLMSADDLCGEAEDEGWGGGSGKRVLWLDTYLSYVAVTVRNHGWLSRSKARELAAQEKGGWATADRAMYYMDPPTRLTAKEREELLNPEDEDRKLVGEAVTWLRTELRKVQNLNDYQHNLLVICSRDVIPEKGMGVAASLIQTYKREMGLVAERKARLERESKSEFFGEVGKREVFTLTVLKVIDLQSDFGVTHLHRFMDEKGNVATWFSSSASLEIGKTYQVKGTVKKQDEYKGIKQTQLTRCAVEGEWFCPDRRCNCLNTPDSENKADTCACGIVRGSWVCLNCQKINGPEIKVCECGHDLKSWRCNKCYQYNVKKAKTCEHKVEGPEAGVCGAPKDSFKCGGFGCGQYNPRKVDVCPKCKCDRNGVFRGGEQA